jgi:hypothetical protein
VTKVIRNQSLTAVADPQVRAEGAESERQPVGEIARPITDDQVAERAHELYLNRGAQHGADLDDWLQAEHELGRSTPANPRKKE